MDHERDCPCGIRSELPPRVTPDVPESVVPQPFRVYDASGYHTDPWGIWPLVIVSMVPAAVALVILIGLLTDG